ncbi:MAG: hypothetical protein MI749_14110 [Desulfovibrionales bacterium]|nr:hypothetical protein [Desulfovibrionales bacterium]
MTYNFDPDKWYDDEFFILESKQKSGKLTREEFSRAVADLDHRLDAMWKRLDGTYQVN